MPAQTIVPPTDFQRFSTANGLSNDMVSCLLQDRKGFLWAGTQNGLNRFDGYKFVRFKNRPGDVSSLSNNVVNAVFEDRMGKIWVGTDGGLNCFEPKTEVFRQFRHDPSNSKSISSNSVNVIFEDSEGQLWVGAGAVLEKFDRKTGLCEHFQPNAFNPNFPTETLEILKITEFKGYLFCSVWGAGAWRFRRETSHFERVFGNENPTRQQSWVNQFCQDRAGNLLAVDLSFYRLDPAQNRFQRIPQKDGLPSLTCVFPTKSGGYVFGTEGKGIAFWNADFEEKWRVPLDPSGNHFNNFVTQILQDRGGEIWVATMGFGLCKFDPEPKKFNTFDKRNGLTSNHLTSFCENSDGKILIGNRLAGVDIFDPRTGRFSHFKRQTNVEYGQNIKTIFQDSRQRIWLGTWGDGVEVLDGQTWQRLYHFKEFKTLETSLPDSYATSICEGSDGKFWIAMAEGFASIKGDALENGIFERHFLDKNAPNQIANARVDVVFCDSKGRIWAGTASNGLYVLDPAANGFQNFRHDQTNVNSLASNKVSCIFEDSKNRIWVGCPGGGLNLYRPEKQHFAHFSESDGLPNDEVQAIVGDAQGMLWLTTGVGISRFDPERKIFKNYAPADGLPSGAFSPLALMRSRFDGRIFAGSKSGLAVFHPDSLRDNPLAPPVFFTHFVKYRAEAGQNIEENLPGISELERLEFSHLENTFTVGFAALNFRNSAKNRYAYRLLGLDENWIFSGERRELTFSNLPPGKYTLQVRASNNDGVWNETPRSLEIKIRPPWWRTWWAMLLWAAILAAAAFQFYRFQLKKQLSEAEAARLRELDTLKTRLYTNITHEFRTPLTVILGNAERMTVDSGRQTAGERAGALDSIIRNGKNLLQLINQLLDLSKLEHKALRINYQRGDVVPFLRYLTESFQSYAQGQNLTLRFVSPVEHFEMDFDPPHLQNVLTNLISNALKFTPSGGIIEVRANSDLSTFQKLTNLILTVSDNGIGISPENLPRIFDRFYQVDDSSTRRAEGTGIGLAYVQELVKLMGGEVFVESELGKGSVFKVVLPVRQAGPVFNFDKNQPLKNADPSPSRQIAPPENSSFNIHNSSSLQVLVIEDNPDVVNYLKACLSESYNLNVAYNGESGIAQAFEQIPDLIVSDVMMPGKDGFEVCDILKNDERTSHIPIVLLTAKADLASRIAGLRRGADAYLAKPFDREELLVTLENLADLRRHLRARFSSVSEILTLETPAEPLPDFPLEDEFILKIKSILEENIADEGFGLPELCQKIGMSRSQLFRKMKALIDRAPADFIKTYRLEKARLLLKSGSANVSEAAWAVGFKDLAHFSKSFLEEFGINPSAVKNV